ncbi:hypothetical protein [Paracoccus sp. (in: a-proteobacteria)]|uniref:hypothetical protein n=1 Tax=Paracoccus sp. TaxID=267 RepID=UPI003A8B54F6
MGIVIHEGLVRQFGLGFLVKGEAPGFILLAGLSLIPFAAAAAILVASTSKEKWYR